MLDVKDGTPDLNHKKQCEAVILLLQESSSEKSVGSVQLALALMADQLDDDSTFSFEPSKYGPLVVGFEKIVDHIVSDGYIERTSTGQNDANALRESTKEYTEFDMLSHREQECLKWVANKHLCKEAALYSFMYRQCPRFFEKIDF